MGIEQLLQQAATQAEYKGRAQAYESAAEAMHAMVALDNDLSNVGKNDRDRLAAMRERIESWEQVWAKNAREFDRMSQQ